MSKHHPDLIMCRKLPGMLSAAFARSGVWCFPSQTHPLLSLSTLELNLCSDYSLDTGDGRCVNCDSFVRPATLVAICDECIMGRSREGVSSVGEGVADAYYCKECTMMEKDRDGCPKIVNLGSAKTDLFYERKKYGFKR